MNPGIFYFYYYTPNHPPCNVGFLKLSHHFYSCSLEVHIRNIPVAQKDALKLGALRVEEDTFRAVFLSEISAKTNAVFAKFDISESELPSPHTLSETDGFFLQLADGAIIAATDPGVKFDPGLLRFTETIQEQTDNCESNNQAETTAVIAETPSVPSEALSEQQPTAVPPEALSEQQPTAVPSEALSEQQPTAVPPENIRKISRRDLRILPHRYWNIANNSFLMHGYHNYNHLLLVEKDGYYLIGVPGVYSMRESHAASLFGFSRFTDEYNQKLTLTDEEKNDYGTFGYWCCEIR